MPEQQAATPATRPPYLIGELAQPSPDKYTAGFWERCARRELAFQQCGDCKRLRHPPSSGCPHCGSLAFGWKPVSGKGTVFSFTIVTYSVTAEFKPYVPYNIVLVEFPDAHEVRLVSNIINIAPEAVKVGMPVTLVWEEAEGALLPRFTADADVG